MEENKIVSTIRIALDENASLPEKIYVSTTYSSVGNIGKDGFGDYIILESPFIKSRELVVDIVSKVSNDSKITKKENLYVLALVTDYDGSSDYKRNSDVTQAKPVLFVYDKKPDSIKYLDTRK